MRSVAAALLLLAAAAASGGELIQFRAPDGRVGMVDDPSKLPPGVVIIERREKAERAEEPDEPLGGASPPAQRNEALGGAQRNAAPARARVGEAGELGPAQKSGDAAVCLHFGLPAECAADQIRSAEGWCERGRDARGRIERAEHSLEQAEEAFDDCETASLRGGYCSRSRLDAAELEAEEAESALGQLEETCRDADCLPGWVRGDCAH